MIDPSHTTRPTINPAEAPPGYYAVPKSEARPADGGNICRACDWRPHCEGHTHRCMPYAITTSDGRELKRQDGCSVVFKLANPATQPRSERCA